MSLSMQYVGASVPSFVSIPIDHLFSVPGFSPELFVKLGDARLVKVAHSLDEFSAERRAWYRRNGVTELFCSHADYNHWISIHQALASQIHRVKQIAGERKLGFMVRSLEMVLNEILIQSPQRSLDPQRLRQMAEVALSSVRLILDHVPLVDVLRHLQGLPQSVLGHSVSVAFHAVLVGRELGWTNERTRLQLILSGLLHQVGKSQLAPELINRPVEALSRDEREEYDRYPELGAEILRQSAGVPQSVVQAVALHRENSRFKMGKSAVRKSHIHGFARVIGVCSEFVQVSSGEQGGRRRPVDAFRILVRERSRYDRRTLAALVRIYHQGALQASQEKRSSAAA